MGGGNGKLVAVDGAEERIIGRRKLGENCRRGFQLRDVGDRGGEGLKRPNESGVDGRNTLDLLDEAGVGDEGAEVGSSLRLEAGLAKTRVSMAFLFGSNISYS